MPRYSRKNKKNRKIQVGGVKGDGSGFAPTQARRSAQAPLRFRDPEFETSLGSVTSPTPQRPSSSSLFDKLFPSGYSPPLSESERGGGAVLSPLGQSESSFIPHSPTIALPEPQDDRPEKRRTPQTATFGVSVEEPQLNAESLITWANDQTDVMDNLEFNLMRYSYFRNGLMKVEYTSNVRDFARDVQRKQANRYTKMTRPLQSMNDLQGDMYIPYEVYNSDQTFDIDTRLTIEEIVNVLNKDDLVAILRNFNQFPNPKTLKFSLINQIKSLRERQSTKLNNVDNYIKNYYKSKGKNYSLRRRENQQRPDANQNMLVSNKYRYQKSQFVGMTLKDILLSLFDPMYHLVFLDSRVLKGKEELPETYDTIKFKAMREVIKKAAKRAIEWSKKQNTPRSNDEIKNRFIEELEGDTGDQIEGTTDEFIKAKSKEADRILIENSRLVLSLIFASRLPFFIRERQYTILGYSNETKIPRTEDDDWTTFQMFNAPNYYVSYPMKVHLVLTDVPSDKVTDKDIRAAGCHNGWQAIRKSMQEICDKESVFERQYHKPMRVSYAEAPPDYTETEGQGERVRYQPVQNEPPAVDLLTVGGSKSKTRKKKNRKPNRIRQRNTRRK